MRLKDVENKVLEIWDQRHIHIQAFQTFRGIALASIDCGFDPNLMRSSFKSFRRYPWIYLFLEIVFEEFMENGRSLFSDFSTCWWCCRRQCSLDFYIFIVCIEKKTNMLDFPDRHWTVVSWDDIPWVSRFYILLILRICSLFGSGNCDKCAFTKHVFGSMALLW